MRPLLGRLTQITGAAQRPWNGADGGSVSQRRANIRTWVLLLLALVPTTAVLAAGIWFWTDRGEELRASESAIAPIDTTVALYEMVSSISRLDVALQAAGHPDASEELIDIAEFELARTQALLNDAPATLAQLLQELGTDSGRNERVEVLTLVADQFVLAVDIVDQQVVGEPPSATMGLLTTLARSNAGGLVLPYERTTREIAFTYAAISSSIEYADVLDRVDNDEWGKQGMRSDGAAFTVESLARYMLHDVEHHLWDAREQLQG